MAFSKIELVDSEWTLIGDNVASITFQNVSQFPIYVNFSASNTAPVEAVGLVYTSWQKEVKKTVTDLTYTSTPNYVYAKAMSGRSSVLVETP